MIGETKIIYNLSQMLNAKVLGAHEALCRIANKIC